jgi:hypothetical protein
VFEFLDVMTAIKEDGTIDLEEERNRLSVQKQSKYSTITKEDEVDLIKKITK